MDDVEKVILTVSVMLGIILIGSFIVGIVSNMGTPGSINIGGSFGIM